MIIRVKKTWKDYIEGDPNHHRLVTRRDFMNAGLVMGAMGYVVPNTLVNSAYAATCPAPVRNPGGLGQFYADGGGSMFAYLMNTQMAEAAANNATVRTNYGIDNNLASIGNPANGGNMIVNTTSAFGAALLAGVPSYSVAQWRAVLNKCSLGTIVGPLNRDDGGESDAAKVIRGLGKRSAGSKDISSGNQQTLAPFQSTSTAAVNTLTVANLATTYSVTPAGLTNAQTMTNAANAALGLSSLFGGIFGLNGDPTKARKGAQNVVNGAGCGFQADAALVDPNYGRRLFDPAQNAALTPLITGLTAEELALLGAFHASALGNMGAVTVDRGGFDYHGNANVAPQQIRAARALAMFLAACDKANARGAFIMASNGSAIGENPRAQANQTIGGNSLGVTTINVNDTTPQGDSGGFFNKIDVVFFDPAGSPPVTRSIGTINQGTGSATSDPKVTSALTAFAGAYYSAALWLGTTTMDLAAIEAQFNKTGAKFGDAKLI